MPIFIRLIYWWLYSFVLWRFIIENERIVVSTSILITLIAGFGLYYLIIYLRKIDFIKRYRILEIILIATLILFLVLSFSYTKRDNWQKLKLYTIDGERVFNPAAPANNYLHPDDLKLFNGIREKRFLSIPWKGTVIGVATDNYPLETKPGTITNWEAGFSDFINADCEDKIEIVREKEVDYIYSTEVDCAEMELIGTSSEGLNLYKALKD